ncbi:MAG: D-aminoacyl-tRNA deacylase [Syntrophomonadaceae bacterium]
MRAVVQRTNFSRVVVNDKETGNIKKGLMVLLGIKKGDNEADARYMMDKIVNLRIFEDQEGKMNRSLFDVQGEIMLVSQFTLYGDVRKGRRPSFSEAELPDLALPLFNYCLNYLKEMGIKVQTGVFGAEMQVEINNDGPCTLLIDSEKLF